MKVCPVCGAHRLERRPAPLETRRDASGVYEVVIAEAIEAEERRARRRPALLETRRDASGVYEVVIAETTEAEERRTREAGSTEDPTVRDGTCTEARKNPSTFDDQGAGGAAYPYARTFASADEIAEQKAEIRAEGGASEVEVGGDDPATLGPGEDLATD
jgi:hypothetical protein